MAKLNYQNCEAHILLQKSTAQGEILAGKGIEGDWLVNYIDLCSLSKLNVRLETLFVNEHMHLYESQPYNR